MRGLRRKNPLILPQTSEHEDRRDTHKSTGKLLCLQNKKESFEPTISNKVAYRLKKYKKHSSLLLAFGVRRPRKLIPRIMGPTLSSGIMRTLPG